MILRDLPLVSVFRLAALLVLPTTVVDVIRAQDGHILQTSPIRALRADSPRSNPYAQETNVNTPSVGAIWDAGGQVFNIKAYGARGDGLTDDTAAIQSAMDAAVAAAGVVYAPPGNYLITHPISAVIGARESSSGFGFRGAGRGTWFKFSGTGAAFNFQGVPPSVPRAGPDLADFVIQCKGSGSGLHYSDLVGGNLQNIQVQNCAGTATSAGFWLDNIKGWVEETTTHNLEALENSIGFRFTTSETPMTDSFGYNQFDFYCQSAAVVASTGTYQVCVQGENRSHLYNGVMRIRANTAGTLLKFVGKQWWGPNEFYLTWEGHPPKVIDQGSGMFFGTFHFEPAQGLPPNFIPPNDSLSFIQSTGTDGARNLYGSAHYTGRYIIFRGWGQSSQGIICDSEASAQVPCSIFVSPNNGKDREPFQIQDYDGSPNKPYLQIAQPSGDVSFRGSVAPSGNVATWKTGYGEPAGQCTTGSLYTRLDGGAGSTLYICEGGIWVKK